MARLVAACALGVVIGTAVGAALGIRAQEQPTDDTIAAAAEAGVDALDLQGAVNTTGIEPRAYLQAVGELALDELPAPMRPQPPAGAAVAGDGSGHPFPGSATLAYIAAHSRYGRRASCVANIESGGVGTAWNPQPWGRFGEHAAGFFGWLPSTAAGVGVRIGNLDSEIAGFDRMVALGRGREFAGILWERC